MANKRQTKKFLKRFHPLALLLLVAVLVVGFFAGDFACRMLVKNDGFVLLGDKEIVVGLGQTYTYTEAGYSVCDLGRDKTAEVVVTYSDAFTKNADGTYTLDTSEEGVYAIFYTVPTAKRYAEIRRVRTFTVAIPEGGES